MSGTSISPELVKKTTEFHGHWCPGLAMGIRAAEWALQEIGKASDEEIVALVETDMCGVDAIQYLTGCTFGKGNLVFKDLGKNAFTFARRRDGKSARLVAKPTAFGEEGEVMRRLYRKMQSEGLTPGEEKILAESRERAARRIMGAELADLFEIKEAQGPIPGKARIMASVPCDGCAEAVMETRTRRYREKTLCIACFESLEKR